MFHNPKNTEPLNRLYAWTSVDEGGEGILAAELKLVSGEHTLTPLITGNLELANQLRHVAEHIGKEAGKTVRLVRYDRAEVVEEIIK